MVRLRDDLAQRGTSHDIRTPGPSSGSAQTRTVHLPTGADDQQQKWDATVTPLIQIRHAGDFAPDSPHIERTAARAVITHDGELLLLRSRHGDYKFPGGGVEVDESAQGALIRELREECGLFDVSVGGLLCTTVELSHTREPGAVFKMPSALSILMAGFDDVCPGAFGVVGRRHG